MLRPLLRQLSQMLPSFSMSLELTGGGQICRSPHALSFRACYIKYHKCPIISVTEGMNMDDL